MLAVSSSWLAASSDVTIAQRYQQLEKEMAKLKAYAARQAGAEAAGPPKPRPVRGDLRKPAGLADLARLVAPASEVPTQPAARLAVDLSISAAQVLQEATR